MQKDTSTQSKQTDPNTKMDESRFYFRSTTLEGLNYQISLKFGQLSLVTGQSGPVFLFIFPW